MSVMRTESGSDTAFSVCANTRQGLSDTTGPSYWGLNLLETHR
jgi:hypothetical protein